MKYQVLGNGIDNWRDGYQQMWPCRKQRNYSIIGDVHFKTVRQTENELVLKRQSIMLEPLKRKLGFFERVVGYIECQTDQGEKYCARIVTKNYAKVMLVSVSLVVMLIAGGFGIYSIKPTPKQPMTQLQSYEAPDGIENTDAQKIVLPAYEYLEVDAKTNKLQTPLINATGNQCEMSYQLSLKKNGKILFSAAKQRLSPGKAWYNFELKEKLAKGKYPILIKVTNYTLKGQQKMNSSSLEATLVVD